MSFSFFCFFVSAKSGDRTSDSASFPASTKRPASAAQQHAGGKRGPAHSHQLLIPRLAALLPPDVSELLVLSISKSGPIQCIGPSSPTKAEPAQHGWSTSSLRLLNGVRLSCLYPARQVSESPVLYPPVKAQQQSLRTNHMSSTACPGTLSPEMEISNKCPGSTHQAGPPHQGSVQSFPHLNRKQPANPTSLPE